MEANEFVAKLKADGSEKDEYNLVKVHQEYKLILLKLSPKDKGSFAVNVLCILCRNLDKVPTWRSNINSRELVILSLDCVGETSGLGPSDQSKVLACVYHLHKHVVREIVPVHPKLVMNLSTTLFKHKNLLEQYAKTYWNMLADRIAYIERLASENKYDIGNLLPTFTQDLSKTIQMYDTVLFCTNLLVPLIKKLHNLYSDEYPAELNSTYNVIFENLSSKSDLKNFKKLPQRAALALYSNFLEIFKVIIENSTNICFKDSVLYNAVSSSIAFLGHQSDIFHCLQTFYLNSFCNILTERINLNLTESILHGVMTSCETTEKLGYGEVMATTYPYLAQMLRQFMEYMVDKTETKNWAGRFNLEAQEKCMILIMLLMKKLRDTKQIVICDGCKARTGLHDAMRLSLCVGRVVSVALSQEMDVEKNLPIYYNILEEQYEVLNALQNMGCSNHEKCLKKIQTDLHNTAILLNKSRNYEYSIKMFDLYLQNEVGHYKSRDVLKNISRGLYNKSICELDFKLHEDALQSAYLSFLLAQPDALKSDKYISLVIEIKSKLLKHKSQEDDDGTENRDDIQMMTILDVCKKAMNSDLYGNFKTFFCKLNFSMLLRHEFTIYAKLWPSILPIAGVWTSLHDLLEKKHAEWLPLEKELDITWTLYEVILETPTVIRAINNECFTKIVHNLLKKPQPKCPKEVIVRAVLLFLKCELDIAEASEKHGWRIKELCANPEQTCITRNVPQEHNALVQAIEAVEMLTLWLPKLKELPPSASLRHFLLVGQVSVYLLLHMARPAHALNLAFICYELAHTTGDTEILVRNAGTILYHARTSRPELVQLEKRAAAGIEKLTKQTDTFETAMVCLCDMAIYRKATRSINAAARLVAVAQARVLKACKEHPDLKFEFAIGRLLEAQNAVCDNSPGVNTLSAVTNVHRHYLSFNAAGTQWTSRRLASLTLKHHATLATVTAVKRCKQLLLWRRSRSAAACALTACSAAGIAAALAGSVCVHKEDDARVTIDDRLKYILGLQPTNDMQQQTDIKTDTLSTPRKQVVEPMRDSQMFKMNQTSPSMPCVTVPGFQMPYFVTHDARCQCYACQTPVCHILACQTAGLEASMYFRAKEIDIASNYFDGVLRMFGFIEMKLKQAMTAYKDMKFEDFVVEIVRNMYRREFEYVQIDILMEAALYELSIRNFGKSDDYIIRIHEVMQEMSEVDIYVKNQVMNVCCTAAHLKKSMKKPKTEDETGLVTELDKLKLSPMPRTNMEPPKTPDLKPEKPPKVNSPVKVDDEEMPGTKYKGIKLNLDDEPSEVKPVTEQRPARAQFKIPVPRTSRPVPENMTPRPSGSQPKVFVTQPSHEGKVKVEEMYTPVVASKSEDTTIFFTPRDIDTTSNDEFFTPMTSIKMYPKKSLRQNIVKNLEQEFATPKTLENKENTEVKTDKPDVSTKSQLKLPTGAKAKSMKVESGSAKSSKVESGSAKSLKVESGSAKSLKVESGSAKTSNIESGSAKSLKVESGSAKSLKVESVSAKSSKVESGSAKSSKVESGSAKNSKVESGSAKSSKVESGTAKSLKVESGSVKGLKDKRALRRATSPGKLETKASPQTRRRQLRQPVNYNLDDKK